MNGSPAPDGEDRLFTAQLALRPLVSADAGAIAAYLSDWDVVKQTVTVPYPYDERSALTWIARVGRRHEEGRQYAFAITRRVDDAMVGVSSLTLIPSPPISGPKSSSEGVFFGEIGYWLGRPHWGQGYGTEAVEAITALGLETLGLRRIEAILFKDNPNSKRVLEKCGYELKRAETRRYPDRGGKRKVLLYAARQQN